jgi:hypothetical protein
LNVLKDKSILYKQEKFSSFEKIGSPTYEKGSNPSSFSPIRRGSFRDKLKFSANKLIEVKDPIQKNNLKKEDSSKKVNFIYFYLINDHFNLEACKSR